jgi:hypothetical protein
MHIRLANLLRELRDERRISRRLLAEAADLNHSAVCRAERATDMRLSTWDRLFWGLGVRLEWRVQELDEGYPEALTEEGENRRERQLEGLRTGKWRF